VRVRREWLTVCVRGCLPCDRKERKERERRESVMFSITLPVVRVT